MPHARRGEADRDRRVAKYRNWQALSGSKEEPEPFVDLIQRDPVVCDHCFRYRYDTVTLEWWRGDLGWMDYETWVSRPDRNTAVPAQFPAQGTRLACDNCGLRGEKFRPLAKHDVIEFAHNIAETLERKHIDHDREALLSTVKDRVSEPDLQSKQDSHVFAPAVRAAVHTTPRDDHR